MADDPLTLLGQVAPEFGVVWAIEDGRGRAAFPVYRPSGTRIEFQLSIKAVDQVAFVREEPACLLPVFCPDRHINPGGWFCLGWGSTSPTTVSDEASARRFWEAVYAYLRLQVHASETGRWSNGSLDWAHGNAAQAQSEAETIASELGAAFRQDLDERKFSVVQPPRKRGMRIHLLRAGREIATVGSDGKLRAAHVPCPCDTPSGRIRDCADHAKKLAAFIVALALWQIRERAYLRDLIEDGEKCCGTLKTCALREEAARQLLLTEKRKKHEQRHRPRRRV